jgi:hypothetical protein
MNAKVSLVWFVVGIIWLAGWILMAAKGFQTLDADLGKGLLWIAGAAVVAILGVFGAIKLNKTKD